MTHWKRWISVTPAKTRTARKTSAPATPNHNTRRRRSGGMRSSEKMMMKTKMLSTESDFSRM